MNVGAMCRCKHMHILVAALAVVLPAHEKCNMNIKNYRLYAIMFYFIFHLFERG
jgi:hypothetical protein